MNKLVATTLENKIHVWDLRHQNKTEGFAHHVYPHDRLNTFSLSICLFLFDHFQNSNSHVHTNSICR